MKFWQYFPLRVSLIGVQSLYVSKLHTILYTWSAETAEMIAKIKEHLAIISWHSKTSSFVEEEITFFAQIWAFNHLISMLIKLLIWKKIKRILSGKKIIQANLKQSGMELFLSFWRKKLNWFTVILLVSWDWNWEKGSDAKNLQLNCPFWLFERPKNFHLFCM